MNSRHALLAAAVLLAFIVGSLNTGWANSTLVIHEWGTLTTKHDKDGHQFGGMNVVEKQEKLPDFVHCLNEDYLKASDKTKRPTRAHPDVTMRLETPVIYFYPPEGFDRQRSFDLCVQFKGGILNQFYPAANAGHKGVEFISDKDGQVRQTRLTEQTVSHLTWPSLSLGSSGSGPETGCHTWTAPRQVDAVSVRAGNGECESYLFYRGIANLSSLFTTRHDEHTRHVYFYPKDSSRPNKVPMTISNLWLMRNDTKRGLAFEKLGPITLNTPDKKFLGEVSADFPAERHAQENLGLLRASVRQALIANGLYAREADAMLNTWDDAYFQQPGTRILYIVPRAWIDEHLPITVSVPAEISRVYIGRVDLHGI